MIRIMNYELFTCITVLYLTQKFTEKHRKNCIVSLAMGGFSAECTQPGGAGGEATRKISVISVLSV